jgi:triosephosphate isomerase
MNQKTIVANWKMNGDVSLLKEFSTLTENDLGDAKFILCPPSVLIWSAIGAGFDIGGQDCHQMESGAFTGDISASMLAKLGCKYTIVGHSERRLYHHETDALIRKKADAATNNNLIPIICIGETIEDRENGDTFRVIESQLNIACPSHDRFMVAYEPVWAIGTGKTATPSDIESVHALIREKVPLGVKILYGGSVNPTNAYAILHLKNVDGVLVGGASLKLDDVKALLKAAKVGD